MNNKKDQMHPEDFRNLIIFALASLAVWFAYETYVLGPQTKALNEAKKARAELIDQKPELLKPAAFVPREKALEGTQRITFENAEIMGSIPLKGGYFDDLSLLQYYKTIEKEEFVTLFSPANTERARYADYGWVSAQEGLKLPNANSIWQIKGNANLTVQTPVTIFWNNGQGLTFERDISFDEHYMFKITQRVVNNSDAEVSLYPYALITQNSIPADYNNLWISHEGAAGFIGKELHQLDYAGMKSEPNKKIESEHGWIGFSDKYWLTALIPQQGVQAKYRFKFTPDPVTSERNIFQTDVTGAEMVVPPQGSVEKSYHLYAGAKKVLLLEEYEKSIGVKNLDLAVDFGWFWFLTYPFFLALHYLGLLVGNMGVAIVILTAILRMAVFPLTSISFRSFAKMKVVAPQISALRETHGDDKEALQQEIVKLYQKEGVNPMSGCLPILVQIPIFFAFYKILLMTIEIRHAPFFGWIQDLSAPDPTSLFNLFGLVDIEPILHIGIWPCLMLLVMLFQKKLNPPPQDKTQRMMMNIFPFFITWIMARFASGLVIYWTFSAFFSVIQQAVIMRSMGVPVYFFNRDHYKEKLEEQVDEGPDVHPLIEMAEQDVEEALFDKESGDQEGEEEDAPKISPPKPKKKTTGKKTKKK